MIEEHDTAESVLAQTAVSQTPAVAPCPNTSFFPVPPETPAAPAVRATAPVAEAHTRYV